MRLRKVTDLREYGEKRADIPNGKDPIHKRDAALCQINLSPHHFTAIKQGKAMLFKADQGESFVSMEGSRVDRISEFSE
jgi:hypothetical protein